jgi:hypothetical protein
METATPSVGETKPKQDPNLMPPWQKGCPSPNPAGRPIGSRNRLSEAVLADMAQHWAKNGMRAIERTFQEDPVAYFKTMVSVLPNEHSLEIFTKKLSEWTVDDAKHLLALLDEAERSPVIDLVAEPVAEGNGIPCDES